MPTINFSGIASGIDSEALIKATSDAATQVRITPSQNKINELVDTDTSLDTLRTKLADLQTLALQFASLNGGGVSKQGISSDETIASATASNGANNGTYSLTVTALAKNETYTFRSTAGAY